MKKIYLIISIFFLFQNFGIADFNKHEIKEGNPDAKIKIYVYESLTCPHCADFHKEIYPNLKKDFIDEGIVQIFFKNFPLDLAGLNAAKITYCLKDGKKLSFLNHLYKTQQTWIKGNTIEEINENLKDAISNYGISGFDFDSCINNSEVEELILNERISASKKYKIQSTPTLVINGEKFDEALKYKNLRKAIEKLI